MGNLSDMLHTNFSPLIIKVWLTRSETQVAGGGTAAYMYRQRPALTIPFCLAVRLKDNKAVSADDFNAAQPKAPL